MYREVREGSKISRGPRDWAEVIVGEPFKDVLMQRLAQMMRIGSEWLDAGTLPPTMSIKDTNFFYQKSRRCQRLACCMGITAKGSYTISHQNLVRKNANARRHKSSL